MTDLMESPTKALEDCTLDELAEAVRLECGLADQEFSLIRQHGARAVAHAIRIGDILAVARQRMDKNSSWRGWIVGNFPFSEGTARNYLRLSTYQLEITDPGLGQNEWLKRLSHLPPLPRVGRTARTSPEIEARVLSLYGDGLIQARIADITGLDRITVKSIVDPEYRSQRSKRMAAIDQRRRLVKRLGLEAAKQKERDDLVKKAGGSAASAYSLIRRCLSELDKAIAETEDRTLAAELRMAMSHAHKAEDQIVAALKAERLAS